MSDDTESAIEKLEDEIEKLEEGDDPVDEFQVAGSPPPPPVPEPKPQVDVSEETPSGAAVV